MARRFFTNADLRESRVDWLREEYKEDENNKTMVSEIIGMLQNKYDNISKEESGKIVRLAFPQSRRKRHHSGTNYFYKGITKRTESEDKQSKPEITALELQIRLREETEKNKHIQSSLDESNSKYKEKEMHCVDLENKLHSERKRIHNLKESEVKLNVEADATKKHEQLTAERLQETKDKLHATQTKLAQYKKQVFAKDRSKSSSQNVNLDLTVISRDQLISFHGGRKLGSGTFGDCFLMQYRNMDVCIKYCRECSHQSVLTEAGFVRKLEGHPNLPLLFGVSPKSEIPPYIVTKFHGDSSTRRNTLQDALYSKYYHPECFLKLVLQCGQALMHIHNKRVLHNDLKCNNVLVDVIEDEPSAVIIDFGKSCLVENARVKRIPPNEREEYKKNYPHIAPELVNMSRSQSFASDVYSYGMLLRKVSIKAEALAVAANMCVTEMPDKRASIDTVVEVIQSALKKS